MNRRDERMGEPCTLITGAASGFGRSIAKKLAASRRLILSDVDEQQLKATQIACETPERHVLWARDLSRLDGIGDDLASLLAANGIGVDHFIHSAGVFGMQPARANEMVFVTRMFTVNLFSVMEIVRPLVQKRVNKGALRSITAISSTATRIVAAGGYTAYAASKGGLNGMVLSLAVELGPTVRVNSILPGIVGTEMNKDYFANPEFVAAIQASHPLGLGQPEDIANTVEFLSSDRARWITGQEIVVDGGRCANR